MRSTPQSGKTSLAQRAALELEHRLVTLQYPPGSLLQEQRLVEDFGLGRTPVREAVLQIARTGLLNVLPRKGLMVAPVSREELLQVLEARRVLERLLVVKAAERASAEQREALRRLATRMAEIGSDVDAYFRIDVELDRLLERCCGNRYLVHALAPLHAHCRRLWYLVSGQMDVQEAVGLHISLTNAVADQDGSGAIRSLNGIIAILDKQLGALDAIS
ncbi:MAG: GntR family transcriptional regulator [Xanthomonadales bacterium]|nr:GntR family transcriptional regulator [Xanthomonadales bacterium]NNL96533.1 GntR family transcriptional regulator [Xanthomonadales bacterium]